MRHCAGQASMSAAIAEQLLNFSSLRSSRWRTATAFWFAFLVSEAARLRHGRDAEVSRPGLQLGRARTRRHRADTCASVSCPAGESASLTPSAVLAQVTARTSALFRLHRWPDSPAFRPLHSLTHSASLIASAARTFAGCSRSFRRSQTAETGTDSGAPKDARHQWPRGFARPRDQQYGRDAPHVAQNTDIAVRPTSFVSLRSQTGRPH